MSKCKTCNDTGWHEYNNGHSVVCNKCCPHDKGWWELSKNYMGYIEGADNRCCLNGCGTMYRDLEKSE